MPSGGAALAVGLAMPAAGSQPASANGQSQQPHRWLRSAAVAASVLAVALTLAGTVWHALPPFKPEDAALLRAFPPRTLPQLAAQRDALVGYAREAPLAVAAAYCGVYVLMQTFAVPGTIMLSLLAGGLYGVWRGGVLVAAVSTLGACCCYCMSWAVGAPLARALWPDRLARYAAEVAARRAELLSYIVFLRATPILPNTFVNVASPIVGVPLAPFALGTLLGCLPNNLFAVNAGAHLGELQSLGDLYSGKLLLLGLTAGAAALTPIYFQRRAAAAGRAAAGNGKRD